ncbi:MAG TPA: TauD/TfdA family dioxygenase [Frankiaceae bacterium]|nr:TauD/TfdA family dioxygenase [Frankiaceae bacterium]
MRSQPLRVSEADLVATGSLDGGDPLPLVISARVPGLDLADWGADQRDFVDARLLEHGAILMRGFAVGSVERFEAFARALAGDLLDYKERAAPRIAVKEKVFTSTEFPADQTIPLHHEMSYSHNWPSRIWFYCAEPSPSGGRTPIASDRRVFEELDGAIKARFMAKKVMYVRNYGEGVDLPWEEAFQTDDPAVVEEYCRASRTTCEWRDANRLRTRAVRQAVAVHPRTGDTVWFNHAHLFHPSSLPAAVRDALLGSFAEDDLPRNVFYGDGSPIPSSVVEEIRAVYDQAAVRFSWEAQDVLLVDNFLVSHGREPYEGPRRVLVAMADLFTSPEDWSTPAS